MIKVMYNGKKIELDDELEPGYVEFDMLTEKETKSTDLDDTMEMNIEDLVDTQELNLGDINEH